MCPCDREENVAKKRVFISFDVDHDNDCKTLLAGQAKHPDSPFDFKDSSVKEHLPGDWKEKVRRRMDNIDVVIFLCGTQTHTAKGVAHEYEIALEKSKDYFLLAAYSDKTCTRPAGAGGEKIYNWTWDNLKKLIGGAR
jgi:antiphage defense system Thoeris ThsB-like protein